MKLAVSALLIVLCVLVSCNAKNPRYQSKNPHWTSKINKEHNPLQKWIPKNSPFIFGDILKRPDKEHGIVAALPGILKALPFHPITLSILQHLVELTVCSEVICLASKKLTSSRTRFRGLQENPVVVIGALNLGVYTLWKIAQMKLRTNHRTHLIEFMIQHFLVPGRAKERKQRRHTVLLAGFSHMDAEHFASNMMALFLFAPRLLKDSSLMNRPREYPQKFVQFYVASIFASCYFDSLLYKYSFFAPKPRSQGFLERWIFGPPGALGASGAISAVEALNCLEFPNDKFKIPSELLELTQMSKDDIKHIAAIEIPNWLVMIGSVLLDMFPMDKKDNISHGAHLGGYLFGLLYYLARRVVIPTVRRLGSKRQPKLIQQSIQNAIVKAYHHAEDIIDHYVCQICAWAQQMEQAMHDFMATTGTKESNSSFVTHESKSRVTTAIQSSDQFLFAESSAKLDRIQQEKVVTVSSRWNDNNTTTTTGSMDILHAAQGEPTKTLTTSTSPANSPSSFSLENRE